MCGDAGVIGDACVCVDAYGSADGGACADVCVCVCGGVEKAPAALNTEVLLRACVSGSVCGDEYMSVVDERAGKQGCA